MKTERAGLILVNMLLLLAFMLFTQDGKSQDMPSFLSRDPAYWYNQYQTEHTRAEGLEKSGRTAIDGLQATVRVANDTIASQNRTIVTLSDKLNAQTEARSKAEAERKLAITELDKLRGKTWAGRQIRLVRDQLSAVGAVALAVVTLKLIF